MDSEIIEEIEDKFFIDTTLREIKDLIKDHSGDIEFKSSKLIDPDTMTPLVQITFIKKGTKDIINIWSFNLILSISTIREDDITSYINYLISIYDREYTISKIIDNG